MTAHAHAHALDLKPANHVPLTPLRFLDRCADVHPDCIAVIHGELRQTWAHRPRLSPGWHTSRHRAGAWRARWARGQKFKPPEAAVSRDAITRPAGAPSHG